MRTEIIAEAGVNHNGQIDIAIRLIEEAAKAGADSVKFQTYVTELCISKEAGLAEYQKKNIRKNEGTQYDLVRNMELDKEAHIQLMACCKANKICFLSSPFDIPSVRMLDELGLEVFKIASGEITNFPMLREIGRLNKRIIMSTGMSEISEIKRAIGWLVGHGTERSKISLLHCNTEYPTPMTDVNLRVLKTLRDVFNLTVGFSDHTLGIEVPIAAVSMGAGIIEKHFTLDTTMHGPDHGMSLSPQDLKSMIEAIRNIEKAMGSDQKVVTQSEGKNLFAARKSIFAIDSIQNGETLTEEKLITLRPGDGIPASEWLSLIGKTALRDIAKGEKLSYNDFK